MKSKTANTKRCAACGQKLPTGNSYTPKPLGLDSRFKRGLTSLVKTLRLIEDQRGRTAAKAALAKLNESLNVH